MGMISATVAPVAIVAVGSDVKAARNIEGRDRLSELEGSMADSSCGGPSRANAGARRRCVCSAIGFSTLRHLFLRWRFSRCCWTRDCADRRQLSGDSRVRSAFLHQHRLGSRQRSIRRAAVYLRDIRFIVYRVGDCGAAEPGRRAMPERDGARLAGPSAGLPGRSARRNSQRRVRPVGRVRAGSVDSRLRRAAARRTTSAGCRFSRGRRSRSGCFRRESFSRS